MEAEAEETKPHFKAGLQLNFSAFEVKGPFRPSMTVIFWHWNIITEGVIEHLSSHGYHKRTK